MAPNSNEFDRRSFLFLPVAGVLLGFPKDALAKDDIFKPNPLTNPLLEQLRIMEQAEKDTIQYGGELEAGNAGNRGQVAQYPRLLVPILKMSDELTQVDSLVHSSGDKDWKEAMQILEQPKYDKITFKKTFNAFADNIYYSDGDRANLYLGGGATPKTEQSLAYLLRNEILTNAEDLRAELQYLLQSQENDTTDLYKYSSQAKSAMKDYLDNVSPYEVKKAKDLIASGAL